MQFSWQSVTIQADNQTAIAYILREGGTRSGELMSLTRRLLQHVDQ